MPGAMSTASILLAVLLVGAPPPRPAPPSRFASHDEAAPELLSLKERATLQNRWLELRLNTLVPQLLRRAKVDAWVVMGREYDEDPVLKTMLPATWISARRRTILLFRDRGPEEGVERLAVARYAIGPFPSAWVPEEQPDQWQRLAELLAERDPARIAVNVSPDFALADGASASELQAFLAALPEKLRARVVHDQSLAIGWLETRIPEELEVYPALVALTHRLIAEGFSRAAIEPGVTTTEDLEWWFRERMLSWRLSTWFHPSVSLQRPEVLASGSFAARAATRTIERGDLLHVDIGLSYLGLNSDVQQHAYVLREGEEAAPAGLVAALAVGNRLQDLLTASFAEDRSGNEVLRLALEQARAEGIAATIYSHPLGLHGHGAGPPIGMWDDQKPIAGRGELPVRGSTVWAIELNAAVRIPEWDGQEIRVMLEEDASFDGREVRYLDGRQQALLLVR